MKGWLGALAFAAVVGGSGTLHAESFTFVNVIDSTGSMSGYYFHAVAMNNAGIVAVHVAESSASQSIRVGAPGALSTLYSVPSGADYLDPFGLGLNDSGTVALMAVYSDLISGNIWKKVLAGNGGPLATIAQSVPSPSAGDFTDFDGNGVSINNAGQVLFRGARWNGTASVGAVATGTGGPVTTIGQGDEVVAAGPGYPINSTGNVAFLDNYGQSLWVGDGSGPATLLYDASGVFGSFGFVSIDDAGNVAFRGVLDDSSTGIYLGSSGPVSTIAHSSGPFSWLGGPHLSGNGKLVFVGGLDSGEVGIYTGGDPTNDKVIAVGDALFGRTVTGLSDFGTIQGINNSGQIVFHYELDDGTRGIALATPGSSQVVPEPGAVVMLAGLGGVLALGFGVRRCSRALTTQK